MEKIKESTLDTLSSRAVEVSADFTVYISLAILYKFQCVNNGKCLCMFQCNGICTRCILGMLLTLII